MYNKRIEFSPVVAERMTQKWSIVYQSPCATFGSLCTYLIGGAYFFPELSVPLQVLLGILLSTTVLWIALKCIHRERYPRILQCELSRPPTAPAAYATQGLGSLRSDAAAGSLYLDLMKRAVSNVLYEDPPLGYFDGQQPQHSHGFDLARRVAGEEIMPIQAHTMIGIRRLDNIQHCVEHVLAANVPGDLLEAGVFRGGSAIFMRAVLKAHHVTDRLVFGCDTFVPTQKRTSWLSFVITPVLQTLAWLPGSKWKHWAFMKTQQLNKSFPPSRDPSKELIRLSFWLVRNSIGTCLKSGTSLDDVRSHFARYGLLDDQVRLLRGSFRILCRIAP